jgi:hypothetical protein
VSRGGSQDGGNSQGRFPVRLRQYPANREGKVRGVLGAKTYQYLKGRRRGIEGDRLLPPGFGQGEQDGKGLIRGRTARQTGEYIQEKIEAVPGGAALIYPDEEPMGGPAGKLLAGSLEPVQDETVPGTAEVPAAGDDAIGGEVSDQRGNIRSPEVFGGEKEPGVPA